MAEPCSRSAACTPATARPKSCAASISPSATARSSPCWARTAPANRRSTGRSPACCGRGAARSASPARPIERDAARRDRRARPDPRAGRPPHLSQHDGARESRSRRLSPRARTRARAEPRARVLRSSRGSRERQAQRAGTLSGGEQQMLAIGRGLMAEPKLLILDEPSLGLSPLLVEELFALIKSINARGHRAAAGRAERGAEPRGGAAAPISSTTARSCCREARPTSATTPISSAPISECDHGREHCAPACPQARSWSRPASTTRSRRWSRRRRASRRSMSPARRSPIRGSGGPTSASSA